MSVLVGCGYRPEFDRYATTKSGGQAMLSAGLMADNIAELIDIYKAGPKSEYYYYPLMILLGVTLALNVLDVILALILALRTYPAASSYTPTTETQMEGAGDGAKDKPAEVPARCPPAMRIMNDILTVTTALVFIIVATKSSLREGRSGLYRRCDNCTFISHSRDRL